MAPHNQMTQVYQVVYLYLYVGTGMSVDKLVNVKHCGASLSEYIGYQQWISRMSVQFRGVNNLG